MDQPGAESDRFLPWRGKIQGAEHHLEGGEVSIHGDPRPWSSALRWKVLFLRAQVRAGELGRYELDIEHFRPKGKIKAWPVPQFLRKTKISFTPPPTAGHGYYLLPYHLLNYTVACKPCNSGLKKSYFPIGGTYDLNGDDPRQMRAEQPWLLYPIGHVDVDPEEVISFYGILPQSISMEPVLRQRGLVTITFFGLDDVIRRKRLMQERAMLIFVSSAASRKPTIGRI